MKTRWWSTYMMLERILSLKGAIKFMFSEEFRNRDHQDKKTLLEQLELSDNDFSVIKDVVHVLMPFKVVQEALEGQNYVNLSLLPIIIKKLRDSLHTNQGAIDDAEQPQFYFMLSEMVDDFETRWGDETKYTGFTLRADRGRITGIPKLAFRASMLDPRTKNSTLKILSIRDKRAIWDDIRNEIITIRQQEGIPDGNAPNNERATTAARPSLPAAKRIKKKGALTVADFMCGMKSSEEEDSETPEDAFVRAIDAQIERYKAEKYPLLNTDTQKYNCPLVWWSENATNYPDIWKLAVRILHIPATSAPAERVFSVASNVISKKRASLTPDNANLLIFLHDNAEFV
jgi:hypothetical protein